MKVLLCTVAHTNDFSRIHISCCRIKGVSYKIKGFYYLLWKEIYCVAWNRALPQSAENPKLWFLRCDLLSLFCSDFHLPALRRLFSVNVFRFLVFQGHMADKEKGL